MIRSPFVSAADLAAELESPTPPRVFDASYRLDAPAVDGDYSAGPARDSWLTAHIPESTYIDIQAQFSDPTAALHYTHPSARSLAEELASLGVGRDGRVVVYDGTDSKFAARLWYLLSWIGVDVRVLDGGLPAWIAAGLPLEGGESPQPGPVTAWSVGPVGEAWVTAEELAARASDDSRPLVCGLPAGSFSGTDATRYTRRGHIPGSVNVSSRDLFSRQGTVRSASELRGAYAAEGVDGSEEVLLYCGGGISASANALTLAAIGITAVRIYDGSLEEWSADGTRPLEIGRSASADHP